MLVSYGHICRNNGKLSKTWKGCKNGGIIPPHQPTNIFIQSIGHFFFKRLLPIIELQNLIPKQQFGFRKHHGTIEQVHRFDRQKYCTGVFLDIAAVFDKVWHSGLLFKLKKFLPINYYIFIKSYLNNKQFMVRHGETISSPERIQAGVPQGSVLGPILDLLFTSDLPTPKRVIIGTFADDTAVLSTASHPQLARQNCNYA